MSPLVFLIEQTATGMYIFVAIGVFLALRSLSRSQRAYRATYFELERDMARFQRVNAITALVLLIEGALIVFGVQRIVAPTLRETLTMPNTFNSVVSDGIFRTPTPPPFTGGVVIDTSNVQLGQVDPAAQILPTPTLTPTPVGTIIPNAAPAQCPDPNVQLQIPANGMIVFEPLAVRGIASGPNFAFYRFEINGPATFGSFATIGVDGTNAVAEMGVLGQFVPSFYTPGEYRFRVSVFDITSTQIGSCTVTIYISEPIPTATPLSAETQ
ncbi:MAG: hypothetical protein IPK19_34425 [Chloroflexi bacterium]|nr:hypothetical protein [Chloroflexota bacterium]